MISLPLPRLNASLALAALISSASFALAPAHIKHVFALAAAYSKCVFAMTAVRAAAMTAVGSVPWLCLSSCFSGCSTRPPSFVIHEWQQTTAMMPQ